MTVRWMAFTVVRLTAPLIKFQHKKHLTADGVVGN